MARLGRGIPRRYDNTPATPLAASFIDDFTVQDTSKWSGWGTGGGTAISIVTGTVEIDATTAYPALETLGRYSLAESSFVVLLAQLPNLAAGTTAATIEVALDDNYRYCFGWTNGGLFLEKYIAGVQGTNQYTGFTTGHLYWRARGAAGALYMETSPDGTTWTTAFTITTPEFGLTNVRLRLRAGCWDAGQLTSGSARFDQVNVPVAPTFTGPLSGRGFGAFVRSGTTAADPPPIALVQAREAVIGRAFDYIHTFWGWNRAFSELDPGVTDGVFGGASGRELVLSWKPEGAGVITGITSGTYNTYIDAAIAWCLTYNQPLTIRFGWEMNGSWMSYSSAGSGGNTAAQYVSAWQYLVNRFRNAGATQVKWFWCANESDFPVQAGNAMEDYWPGSSYVDIIGFDAYNFGDDSVVRPFDSWRNFDTIMATPYARVAAISSSQPIWLGEYGSTEYTYPNSTNVPDAQNTSITTKALWVADSFAKTGYSRLGVLLYFDQDSTTESGVVRDWRFDSSTASADAFAAALGGPTQTATVAMVGAGTLAITPAVTQTPTIGFTGSSTTTVTPLVTKTATVTMTATSTLAVTSSGIAVATVAMAASSTMSVTAAITVIADVAITNSSTMSVTGSVDSSVLDIRVAGAATSGGAAPTAINPVVGTGAEPGDLSLLSVFCKPYTATITTPSGWTLIGEATSGTTASAIDQGSTKVAVYYKVSATPGAIGTISQSGANTMGAVIHTYQNPLDDWNVAEWTYGADDVHDANYSATAIDGLDVATGDRVFAATAINADSGTLGSVVLGGMSGATITNSVQRTNNTATAGDDIRFYVGDAAISGGSSNVAPAFSYNNSSSTAGVTLFVRLRIGGAQQLTATVTMDGASGLTVTAAVDVRSAIALTGTSTLGVTATQSVLAAVTMTSASTLAITGTQSQSAAPTFVGNSTLSVTGTKSISATVSMPATSTMAVTGTKTITATVPMIGASSLSVTGTGIPVVTTAFVSSSTLAVTTSRTVLAAVPLPGSSSLAVTATVQISSAVAMPGTSTMDVSIAVTRVAAVAMTSSSTLSVTGSKAIAGAISFIGTSSLSLTSQQSVVASVALPGASTLSISGRQTISATVSMASTSEMTIAVLGMVTSNVTMAGSSSLTVAGTKIISAVLALPGSSTLTVTPSVIHTIAIPLPGTSTLSITGLQQKLGVVAVTGASSLAVTATVSSLVSIPISGSSTLGIVSALTILAAVPVVGTSTFAILVSGQQTVTVSMTGTSTVSVTAVKTIFSAVTYTGTSTLAVTGTVTRTAVISVTGSSTLTVTATRMSVATVAISGSSFLGIVAGSATIVTATVALISSSSLVIAPLHAVPAAILMYGSSYLNVAPTVSPVFQITGGSSLGVAGLHIVLAFVPMSGANVMLVDIGGPTRPQGEIRISTVGRRGGPVTTMRRKPGAALSGPRRRITVTGPLDS